MYLTEDRVRGECDVNVVGLHFLFNALMGPMLGTGVEARRGMGSSLCQVGVRHTGSGADRLIPLGMISRSDVPLRFSNWSRNVADGPMARSSLCTVLSSSITYFGLRTASCANT